MTKVPVKKPISRREVELAKPIIQKGKELKPGEDKALLTEAQIARLTKSGHIASTQVKE